MSAHPSHLPVPSALTEREPASATLLRATGTRASRRAAVLVRARGRRDGEGAAMFIVAITLGLLAAMGVYALSATAMDVRAAGHMREAAQAQSAGEHGLILAAETFTPGSTPELVRTMMGGQSGGVDVQSTHCKTARTWSTGSAEDRAAYRSAEACLSLSGTEMKNIAERVNPWTTFDATYGTFTAQSFGSVPNKPFMRIEVTNPMDAPPPTGTALSDRYVFTQLTVTVFVDMKPTATDPAQTISVGRGRITAGPYFR